VSSHKILVCSAQVPLHYGGAEIQSASLIRELRARGHRVDPVAVPFKWYPPEQVLSHALVWRLLDLTETNGEKIDIVIGTKFPSYFARHPNKVIWLTHQFRQAYDLYGSEAGLPNDSLDARDMREAIVRADEVALKEARKIFTISMNTAARLRLHNQIDGEVLYIPPALAGRYFCAPCEPYVLSVGRLDKLKRISILIDAIARSRTGVRAIIAGEGAELKQLRQLTEKLGAEGRVHFIGRVSDEDVLDLYSRALAVYFAPYDEDYGLVAVEALASGKPVITASDSGGPLEFVQDGVTGLVCSPTPSAIADAIDQLAARPRWAQELGATGRERVQDITWERVLERLLG
jgi:glycosyltransferase involved in cell wall biosynthesis